MCIEANAHGQLELMRSVALVPRAAAGDEPWAGFVCIVSHDAMVAHVADHKSTIIARTHVRWAIKLIKLNATGSAAHNEAPSVTAGCPAHDPIVLFVSDKQ